MYRILFFRAEVISEKRVKRWAIAMEELVSDPTGKNIMSLNMWGIFMSHNRMLCNVLHLKFLCHTISIPCAQWYKKSFINCPSYILHYVTYSKKQFLSPSFIMLGMIKSYGGLFRSL